MLSQIFLPVVLMLWALSPFYRPAPTMMSVGHEVIGRATVWDGGTIALDIPATGQQVVVRLADIRRLPSTDELGLAAATVLSDLVGTGMVSCLLTSPLEGGFEARCAAADGSSLGIVLVSLGLAHPEWSGIDQADRAQYENVLAEAQTAGNGLWQLPEVGRPLLLAPATDEEEASP